MYMQAPNAVNTLTGCSSCLHRTATNQIAPANRHPKLALPVLRLSHTSVFLSWQLWIVSLLLFISNACCTSLVIFIMITDLELLPRQLRIKLLLLLPAVDVCKLEGTSVTHDISMNDEIWEKTFKATCKTLNIWRIWFHFLSI